MQKPTHLSACCLSKRCPKLCADPPEPPWRHCLSSFEAALGKHWAVPHTAPYCSCLITDGLPWCHTFFCIFFPLCFTFLHSAVPHAFVLWMGGGARLEGDLREGESEWLTITSYLLVTRVRVTSQYRQWGSRCCGGMCLYHGGDEPCDAHSLFTGGSLRGLLRAPLHPAQVWSGADMYPFHGSWCSRTSAVTDFAFWPRNEFNGRRDLWRPIY